MSIRLVCFIAAVVAWPSWLSWVFAAAAVFVPLFAVVMANAGDQRDDGFRLPSNPSASELPAHDGED
jgi:hypothetical protein